jgi:hypothetical protein
MLVHEHGSKFGELVRRVVERGKDDRPLVESVREQLHLVGAGALESVGQVVGAGSTDQRGELFDGVVGDGRPASIIRTSLRPEVVVVGLGTADTSGVIQRLLCRVRGHKWVTTSDAVGDLTVCERCGRMRRGRGGRADQSGGSDLPEYVNWGGAGDGGGGS